MSYPSSEVSVEVQERPGCGHVLARVRGEIDLCSLPAFRAALAAVTVCSRVVVVDLDEVDHLSAGGLRFLLELQEAQERRGGGLVLLCAEHRPARLLLRALGVPAIGALPRGLSTAGPTP